jgi:pyruvate,water dikinase
MLKINELFKNIFKAKIAKSPQEIEELKTLFQSRYHNFKLLLSANNKALEIMSEIEEALSGSRVFGMSFIKSKSTSVLVNVYKIIKNLDALAPDKYKELYSVFQDVKQEIDAVLAKTSSASGEKLILHFEEIDESMSSYTGTKMARLGGILKNTPYKVPHGFVITSKASQMFFGYLDLQSEIDRRIQANHSETIDSLIKLSSDIRELIISSPIPIEILDTIKDAFTVLEKKIGNRNVSLRSSAIGEDSLGASFAGQYSSRLNVTGQNILEAYKEILSSMYNLTAITYRLNKGIADQDVSMCVGCMVMVDAVCGGVVYTGNPLSSDDDSIIINSAWGLPKAVVDGSINSDNFVIERSTLNILNKEISYKTHKLISIKEGGLLKEELKDNIAQRQSLSDIMIIDISKMALTLERYYSEPLDIEWAIDTNDDIHILQCRPLQKIARSTSNQSEDSTIELDARIFKGGINVSQGTAYGTIYIVENVDDMMSFPEENGILVVKQSLPRWAALLGRACALITEQGGVVGHLATVARELDKPAIFSAYNITGLVSTGDVVTIDSGRTSIYKGHLESVLKRHLRLDTPMAGSRVHKLLKEVSRHIVPLNLLDPDSLNFTPDKCKTLHDITRYCHEKSVKEMFRFGSDHHFSQRASKQLVYKVPLKWWVINLDDGFREDVLGKHVDITNIVSIPFLALWEGIMAVPWSGPPSIDTKGFISILHQATVNTDLDPTMASQYSNKNYFLISKNFCSLVSRFGFHFATVETMLSERVSENYAGFIFKGGAADLERRIKRARFLGRLLEEYGFYVQVRDDSLNARAEAQEIPEMEKRLKVLGYLLMHTRQLDMIMSNDALVNNYWITMKRDLDSIVDRRG